MNFGERLKTIRVHRGLTQRELGNKVGFKSAGDVRIAQYETGGRTPKKELIEKFCKVLNVSPTVFSPNLPTNIDELKQALLWVDTWKELTEVFDRLEFCLDMFLLADSEQLTEDEYMDLKLSIRDSDDS